MRPFRLHSNAELLNLIFVSNLFSNHHLIDNSEYLINLSSKLIGVHASNLFLGKTVGKVFSAGETQKDLHETLSKLFKLGQGSVIDYCAEGEILESEMNNSVDQISAAIKTASKFPNSAVAVKISSLIAEKTLKKVNSLQLQHCDIHAVWEKSIFHNPTTAELKKYNLTDEEVTQIQNCMERAWRLSGLCEENDLTLMIDAEQTYLQSAIDGLAGSLQKDFNKEKGRIITTFQCYLVNSRDNLESYIRWATEKSLKKGIKLVRGAYRTEEAFIANQNNQKSPINPSKLDTDHSYDYNLEVAISSHNRKDSLCIATHNEKSIDFAQFLMSEKRIHRKLDGITFAQLLGIKTQLSAELVSEEFIVQKYTPFGPFNKLIPYLLRRAQEQKDMLSELNDQIDMIFKELNFRANK